MKSKWVHKKIKKCALALPIKSYQWLIISIFSRMVRTATRLTSVRKWVESQKLETACVELWANLSLRKVYKLCVLQQLYKITVVSPKHQSYLKKNLYLLLLVGDSHFWSLSECLLSIFNLYLQLLRDFPRSCYLDANVPWVKFSPELNDHNIRLVFLIMAGVPS